MKLIKRYPVNQLPSASDSLFLSLLRRGYSGEDLLATLQLKSIISWPIVRHYAASLSLPKGACSSFRDDLVKNFCIDYTQLNFFMGLITKRRPVQEDRNRRDYIVGLINNLHKGEAAVAEFLIGSMQTFEKESSSMQRFILDIVKAFSQQFDSGLMEFIKQLDPRLQKLISTKQNKELALAGGSLSWLSLDL